MTFQSGQSPLRYFILLFYCFFIPTVKLEPFFSFSVSAGSRRRFCPSGSVFHSDPMLLFYRMFAAAAAAAAAVRRPSPLVRSRGPPFSLHDFRLTALGVAPSLVNQSNSINHCNRSVGVFGATVWSHAHIGALSLDLAASSLISHLNLDPLWFS